MDKTFLRTLSEAVRPLGSFGGTGGQIKRLRVPEPRDISTTLAQLYTETRAWLVAWLTPWYHRALLGILALAAICNFYQLSQVGYGNLYYAAAVKSMVQSWHNFFFVSFDPGGFVTVDKPPLGFWIQAASAKLFGFSGFSILLPEVLAGILAVAVLYHLVARVFGPVPGLLAALALALTPISVVTSRDNTIDSLLVLTVLFAAWAVCRAAETGRLRWLLLGAVLVGLGFNIKMLEAYLVVPAFGLLYLLAAPHRLWVRAQHLALAGLVLVAISFAWVTAVDLTPASARPYVGSTQTNSELDLALGYNGLQRLTGRVFGGGGAAPATGQAPGDLSGGNARRGGGQPGGFFGGETGAAGPLRLLNEQLGPQISWLLVLGLLGMLATGWGIRPRALLARLRASWPLDRARWLLEPLALDRRQQAFILWGAWFLTQAVFFSVAGFFHTYYMVMLAPSIAALAGVGVVALWQDYGRIGWRGWLLPLALVLTALSQALLLAAFPSYSGVLTPLILGACLVIAAIFVRAHPALGLAARRVPSANEPHADRDVAEAEFTVTRLSDTPLGSVERAIAGIFEATGKLSVTGTLGRALLGVGVAALLLAPATWVAVSITQVGQGGNLLHAGPAAAGATGPGANAAFGGAGFGAGNRQASTESIQGTRGTRGADAAAVRGAEQQAGDGQLRVNTSLVRYLQTHDTSERYLFATTDAMTAAPYILATGKPVMAMGGFSGGDPILTPQALAQLVTTHQVRYVMLSNGRFGRGQLPPGLFEELPPQLQEILEQGGGTGGFGGFGGRGGATSATSWVTGHCATVPASAWGGSTSANGAGGQQLYDCAATSGR